MTQKRVNFINMNTFKTNDNDKRHIYRMMFYNFQKYFHITFESNNCTMSIIEQGNYGPLEGFELTISQTR